MSRLRRHKLNHTTTSHNMLLCNGFSIYEQHSYLKVASCTLEFSVVLLLYSHAFLLFLAGVMTRSLLADSPPTSSMTPKKETEIDALSQQLLSFHPIPHKNTFTSIVCCTAPASSSSLTTSSQLHFNLFPSMSSSSCSSFSISAWLCPSWGVLLFPFGISPCTCLHQGSHQIHS